MKVETTIALPEELLRAVDERSTEYGGRSRLIETAIRAFFGKKSEALAKPRRRSAADLPVFHDCRPLTKLPSRAELYDEIYGDGESSGP